MKLMLLACAGAWAIDRVRAWVHHRAELAFALAFIRAHSEALRETVHILSGPGPRL